jgi:hypothetical protein
VCVDRRSEEHRAAALSALKVAVAVRWGVAKAKPIRFVTCDSGQLMRLAAPALECLEVWVSRAKPLAPGLSLLAAAKVPALRRLDFVRMSKDKAISLDFLEAFLTSKLLSQLEWLAFRQEVLDTKGIKLLCERREALAHLRGVFIDTCEPEIAMKIVEAFGAQSEDRRFDKFTYCIGAWQTWPHPSPDEDDQFPPDLVELRSSSADAIERYWKSKREV